MNSKIYIDQLFNNFDEFLQTLNEYCKESFTLWKTFSSAKRADNDDLKYLHLKCIHHRTPEEITTKSTGQRPKQAYVAPHSCLAEIRINYEITGSNKFKYQIVKCKLDHVRINSQTNLPEKAHEISEDDFLKHPSNRRLNDDEEKEINSKFETGSDAKMIAQYMSKKTGKWLTIRDIWNVRNKYINKQLNNDESNHPLKQFEQEMNKRVEIDSQNNFRLIYDEETNNTLLMVYYQNNEMKKLYAQYGEIIFVDGTYSLNQNNYPVYLIAVRDCNGNSQIVAFAIVAYERQLIIDKFIELFSKMNPIKQTNSIMIDKDLTEWNVLSKYFPHADVFICKFHCEQTFSRSIKNKELLPILTELLNCETQQQFESAYEQLTKTIDLRDKQYLETNWLNETFLPMWVKYKRIGKTTLDSDTNNSVESLNKLLKQFIKKKTTLANCLSGIFKLIDHLTHKYREKEYTQRTKVIIDRSVKNDTFIEYIYKKFTPYAADIIKESYNLANKATYKIDIDGDNVTLTSSKNSSTVSNFIHNPICTCFDYWSGKLPCRHIIYIRKSQNLEIITDNMIPQRWANRLHVNVNIQPIEDTTDTISYVNLNSLISKSTNQRKNNNNNNNKVDENVRFNEAKRIINELAQVVAKESSNVFYDRMEQLLIIKEMWEKNINFTLKPISSEQNDKEIEDVSIFNNNENDNLNSSIESKSSASSSNEIQQTTAETQPSTSQPQILLINKELAKNVPKRGAPTIAERKRKAKSQAATDRNSKSIKINESNCQLSEFIKCVIINNSESIISNILNKNELIDEEHVIVDPKSISPSILQTGLIDSNGLKKDQLIEFFTVDGFIMLENTLISFLKSFKICNSCSLSCESKFITCGNCKLNFHLKCVNRTYVPIKKIWKCNSCIN